MSAANRTGSHKIGVKQVQACLILRWSPVRPCPIWERLMDYPHFVSIEQEGSDGSIHHYVVHTRDPKMAIKFSAECVSGRVRPGTIQRISVPNSWAGQYSQYAKLVTRAERFFRATLCGEEPAAARMNLS